MPVNIHGKQYITVAERLTEARKDIQSINTEVIPNGGAVVIKATVVTEAGTFTGISSANPDKAIEKSSPYEVAETSAVGRALGFAGYGIIEGIASADEMAKAGVTNDNQPELKEDFDKDPTYEGCPKCGNALVNMTTKTGKRAMKCSTNRWNAETREAEGCDYIKWEPMRQEDL